jgi:hypothetical protein
MKTKETKTECQKISARAKSEAKKFFRLGRKGKEISNLKLF